MAATAYAALRSLLTTISMEQTPSPLHPPFLFSAQLIEALLERVRFMVDFLERGWKGAEHLEPRITRLAYAAEDAIEIPIVDQIRSRNAISCREEEGSSSSCNDESGSIPMGQDLESIIHDLDLIKAEMMLLIQDKSTGMIQYVHLGGSTSSTTSSSAAPPKLGKTKMVGFEEDKSKIIAELTWHDHQPGLQIIPIVGMGGIGKTTLARDVFDDNHIMMHFDIRIWVTVSQECNVNDILEGVVSSIPNPARAENLREQVYRSLFNRRYLVIFDDMWSTYIWDEIKQYFPDNNNGSRTMVTTRLTNLAAELSTGFMLGMKCLDEENSWNLFCEKVFAQKSCPLELHEVGKKIVRNCRGLPLAIIVIGGLLSKSDMMLKYWEHVVEDFHSCLYSNDDDHCSKILFLSYNHLPVHLKPCLLYLGVFPEDDEIRVSKLMKLWIAEGFLKPIGGKTLEETAEEYLKELIERNFIIMVSTLSRPPWRNFRCCIIHDLLRELCLREAQTEMFYCVLTEKWCDVRMSVGYQRRIVISLIRETREKTIQYSHLFGALRSMSHVRTLIMIISYRHKVDMQLPIGLSGFMLLRILFSLYSSRISQRNLEFIPCLVNMRYLSVNSSIISASETYSISSINLFRNFQMLDDGPHDETPTRIWNLVQLRQVKTHTISLAEPSYCIEDQRNNAILENLHTLGTIRDFTFSEEAIKRIPNIKKLTVDCFWGSTKFLEHKDFKSHLECLKKLESFEFTFIGYNPLRDFLQGFAFPPSLKKLSLFGCQLRWENLTAFGSLPNLEVLKMDCRSFVGPEWNPVEGEFRRLKLLKMSHIKDQINWNADSTHFPRLEQLHLDHSYLKEIPLDIGDISTLQLICVDYCSFSVWKSAENILEEQQNFGNDILVVEVTPQLEDRMPRRGELRSILTQRQRS